MNRKEIVLAIGIFAAMAAILTLVYIGTATVADEVTATRGETDNSYMDTATYIGSSGCIGCHSDKATLWSDSTHTKMLQDPDATTVLPPSWSGAVNLTSDGTYGNITLYYDSGAQEYWIDIGPGYNYSVWKTMGGVWKQRYVVEIGASKYIAPLQWNTATSEWVAYHLTDWYAEPDTPKDMALTPIKSWDRGCAGCHSTNTTIAYVGTEWVATYTELNIGCEACHGPGSSHSAAPIDEKKNYIWRSADSQICGQCHNRGASIASVGGKTMGYPWGADGRFHPGDDLADYFDSVDPVNDTSKFWPNGMPKSHRQQYIDWATTSHSTAADTIKNLAFGQDHCMECHSTDYYLAEEAGDTLPTKEEVKWSIECVRCHTPHGTTTNDKMLILPEDETCGQCHTTGDSGPGDSPHHPNADLVKGTINITELSGSAWMGGKVDCSDCHMVLVAKSAILGDIPSHTFGFADPQETIDYGMPNGCQYYCHDGVSGSLMTEQEALDNITAWQTNYATRLAAVELVVDDAEAHLTAAADLGFTQAEIDAAQTAFDKAKYAYQYVESDASDGAHNNPFQMEILDFAETTAQGVINALEPGEITGVIKDKDGNPVEDAEIRSDGTVWDTTDADGEFSFSHAPGTHSFDVYYENEDVGDVSGNIPVDVGDVEVDVGGEEAPLDMMWIYLALAVIIIVVIIIAVVAASRRRGAPPEEPFEEEEPPTIE